MSTLRIKAWGQEWTIEKDAHGDGWRANRDDAQLLPGTDTTVPAHTLVDSSPWGIEAAVSEFVERETAAATGTVGGKRVMTQLTRMEKGLKDAILFLRHVQPLRLRGDQLAGLARCADYADWVAEHLQGLPGPAGDSET